MGYWVFEDELLYASECLRRDKMATQGFVGAGSQLVLDDGECLEALRFA